MTADVEMLRAENKRLANALQSLLRYVERCREAGVLVCDDIGPEEFARYELEQALSLPPEQPAAALEAAREDAAEARQNGYELGLLAGAQEAERLRGVIARYERKLDAAIDQARGNGGAQ